MMTRSGTTYRGDNDENTRVESEQGMFARSSSSPVLDTDSQSDNRYKMHPHYNSHRLEYGNHQGSPFGEDV
ncbi:hypothetical protein K439DRAFT_1632594 [Ramaria rubella]|nr:hypothetical protein K439DRAFT_1632594 [Ramaria rubella]